MAPEQEPHVPYLRNVVAGEEKADSPHACAAPERFAAAFSYIGAIDAWRLLLSVGLNGGTMKAALTILVLSVLSSSLHALSPDTGVQARAARNVVLARKQQAGGFVVIGLGMGLVGASVPLLATADWSTQKSGMSVTATTDDYQGIGGLFMALAGIPVTTLGTVMAIRAGKRKRFNRRMLIRVSGVDGRITPRRQQILLRFLLARN